MSRETQVALTSLVERVSKVRKWLVFLTVLKGAAAALFFVALYVCAYAVLDHYIHFGAAARVIAFSVLGGGVAFLLYLLTRTLTAHISCSAAARHIENRHSLDQQLVTAIEYYENERHYPYSKALAEHIVRQVHQTSSRLRFDSTVPKWQAWASSAAIFIGLCAGVFFLVNNYAFFSTYLARLTRPLDAVSPLPKTQLVCLTGDLTVERGTKFTVEAEIRGRVPDQGSVEIAPEVPPDAAAQESPAVESAPVAPVYAEDALPRFKFDPFLDVGAYRYRFTAADAVSQWHTIRVSTLPKIKSLTAEVTLPASKVVKPYTAEIKDFDLDVLKGSSVALTVRATEPLTRATVKGLDGAESSVEIAGTDSFLVTFTADRKGEVRFTLESALGVPNDRLPPLEVTARPNDAPEIEVTSPGGDVLAADVASIPLTFEIRDDFGLESARLYLDIAGKERKKIDIPVTPGEKSTTFTHMLELEDYDLNVGDSIVYYAEASDIDIGTAESNRAPGKCDVYLIEVRPYRVEYRIGTAGSGTGGGEPPETLRNVLEYSRAILKKTWDIARKNRIAAEDMTRLLSIKKDVDYCIETLKTFESDPRTPFVALAPIADIQGYFGQAGKELAAYSASRAVDPETKAYQELRKLVNELYVIPPPGRPGQPPKPKPERYAVRDSAHLKRFDSARVADETERLADELAQAAEQEEQLGDSFDRFLAQQKQPAAYQQKTTDEKSTPGQIIPVPGISPPEQPNQASGQPTFEGPEPPQYVTAAPPPSTGRPANPRERTRMLAARQAMLQEQVDAIQAALRDLPQPDAKATAEDKARADARKEADAKIDEAKRSMANAGKNLNELNVNQDDKGGLSQQTSDALSDAAQRLTEAKDILAESVQKKDEIDESIKLAEELTKLADQYEKSRDPATKARLAEAIERAQQRLQQMPQQSQQQGQQQGQSPPSGGYGPASPALGYPTVPQVTNSSNEETQIARFLAMKFWTIALEAQKKASRVSDDEASNAELYKLENDFYEKAARYRQGQAAK
jgi:hypothetical protein